MSQFLKARRIEVFIIVAVVAVFGITYALTQKTEAPTTTTQNQTQQNYITYEGQDGRSALELLRVFHQVETKETSFGPQIVGIDGYKPDESNSYWALYVNGELAQVGAHQYITKNGERIEWKVESF